VFGRHNYYWLDQWALSIHKGGRQPENQQKNDISEQVNRSSRKVGMKREKNEGKLGES